MIPFSLTVDPTFFTVSILLYLLQLFLQSLSSLHITHTILVPSNSNTNSSPMPQKRLLRLPHVFGKVLELPLRSNADVFIQDKLDCIRFVAKVDNNVFEGEVKAQAVKIYPGVTKVVVRGGGGKRNMELLLEILEADAWRCRLPESTRPELATAVFVGKELVVTIPKGGRGGTDVFDGFSVDDGMGVRGVGRRGRRVFMKEK